MVNDTLMGLMADLIAKHEGFEGLPYKDPRGFLTLGYGRNLDSKGLNGTEWTLVINKPITPEQGRILLVDDVNNVLSWVTKCSWWDKLSDTRKTVIVDMAYNIGQGSFNTFQTMIRALEDGNWNLAARAMEQSKWYLETGLRAKDDVLLMLNG